MSTMKVNLKKRVLNFRDGTVTANEEGNVSSAKDIDNLLLKISEE